MSRQSPGLPLISVQLVVHLTPTDLAGGAVPALYRTVERRWPGVPRAGDPVSLGGGDRIVEDCLSVEWRDGGVTIKFQIEEEFAPLLRELGFRTAAEHGQ